MTLETVTPCPYCDEPPIILNSHLIWSIWCPTCRVSVSGKDKYSKALEDWESLCERLKKEVNENE